MLGCRTEGMIGTPAKGATHGRYVRRRLPFFLVCIHPRDRSNDVWRVLLQVFTRTGPVRCFELFGPAGVAFIREGCGLLFISPLFPFSLRLCWPLSCSSLPHGFGGKGRGLLFILMVVDMHSHCFG